MAIEKFEQIAFSLNPFRLRKFSFLWLSQGCHIGEVIEIWRILKVLGCKYFGLAIWQISGNFLKDLASNFLVWLNVRPADLHVFAYIFICRLFF